MTNLIHWIIIWNHCIIYVGQRQQKAAQRKSKAYIFLVEKYSAKICDYFGIDVDHDIPTVHPNKFCRPCYTSMTNNLRITCHFFDQNFHQWRFIMFLIGLWSILWVWAFFSEHAVESIHHKVAGISRNMIGIIKDPAQRLLSTVEEHTLHTSPEIKEIYPIIKPRKPKPNDTYRFLQWLFKIEK